MPDGFKLGSAWIEVDPNLDGFKDKVKAALESDKSDLKIPIIPDTAGFKKKVAFEVAKDYHSIKIPVEPDTYGFKGKMQLALDRERGRVSVQLDPNLTEFQAQVKAILERNNRDRIGIGVDAETGKFKADVDKAVIEEGRKKVTITVDSNKSQLDAAMSGAGGSAGNIFKKAFSGAVNGGGAAGATGAPGGGGGGLVAGIAGAVVIGLAVLPAAMAAAGALSGVSFGTALVIELNKTNKQFKAIMTGATKSVENTLRAAVAPMVGPVEAAFGQIAGWVKAIEPQLRTLFTTSAQYLMPFLKGIESLVTNLLPGFNNLLKAAGPTVTMFSNALGLIGTYMSRFFDALIPGLKGSNAAFMGVINLVGTLLVAIGKISSSIASSLGPAIGVLLTKVVDPLIMAFANNLDPILKALSPLFNSIAAALAKVTPTFTALITVVVKVVVSALTPLINVIASLMPYVSQAVVLIGNSLVKAFVILSPAMTQIGKLVAQLASQWLPPLLNMVVSLIGPLTNVSLALLKAWLPALVQLTPALSKLITNLTPLIDLLAKVVTWVVTVAAKFEVDLITKAIGPTVSWLAKMISTVVDVIAVFVKWAGNVNDWKNLWQQVWTDVKNWWDNIIRTIESALNRTSTGITNWAHNIINALSSAWSTVYHDVDVAWGNVANHLHQWWADMVNFFSGALHAVENNISGAWTNVYHATDSAWGTIANYLHQWWSDMVNFFSGAYHAIASGLGGAWNSIFNNAKGVWGDIQNFFHQWWSNISNFFSGAYNSIRSGLSSAWNGIWNDVQSVWHRIGNFFTGFWSSLKSGASAAVQGFKNAWSGLENAAKVPVNFVIGTIYNHGIVPVINDIAGIIGQHPLSTISGFASGTAGAPPGWAWVGEEGPELVKMTGGETVLPSPVSMATGLWGKGRGFANGTPPVPGTPAAAAAAINQQNQKEKQLLATENQANPVGWLYQDAKTAVHAMAQLGADAFKALKKMAGSVLGAGIDHIINPLINAIPGTNNEVGSWIKSGFKQLEQNMVKWIVNDTTPSPDGGLGGGSGAEVAAYAKSFATGKNHPYVTGGATPNGWDCSGFSAYVYDHFGYFPGKQGQRYGTSETQFADSTHLQPGGPVAGALVFFDDGIYANPGHVGVMVNSTTYAGADSPSVGTVLSGIGGNVGFRIPKGGFHAAPAGGGTGTDEANGIELYKYLRDNLFNGNKIAAAGATASIWGESLWNPEASGTGGRGLIGWTPPSLISDAVFKGGMATQLPAIIQFVGLNGDMGVIQSMTKASSVADAANMWMRGVERAGISDVHGTGLSLATAIMNRYASGTGAAEPGWAWVGEAGPELVHMTGGETVLDAHTSRFMTGVDQGFATGTTNPTATRYKQRAAAYRAQEQQALKQEALYKKLLSNSKLTAAKKVQYENDVIRYEAAAKRDAVNAARMDQLASASLTKAQQKAEAAAKKAQVAAAKKAQTLLTSEQRAGNSIIAALAGQFSGSNIPSTGNISSDLSSALKAVTTYYSGAKAKTLEQNLETQANKMQNLLTEVKNQSAVLANAKAYATSVTSNLTSYASLSSLGAVPSIGSGTPYGANVVRALKQKLAALDGFGRLLKSAAGKKINTAFLQEAIALGPDGGTQYLQAILGGGSSLINTINSLSSQINTVETSLGEQAANVVYDPKSEGKGFLLDLQKSTAALDKTMVKLGNTFAATVAKDLRIPAKDLPKFAAGGYPETGLALVGEQGPELVRFTNPGARVYSNPETQAMLHNGQPITVNFYGTQHPTPEQMAVMQLELSKQLGAYNV